MASVFPVVFTTDVDTLDDTKGDDALNNCVEVVVVIVVFAEDPHVTFKFPFVPPDINKKANI